MGTTHVLRYAVMALPVLLPAKADTQPLEPEVFERLAAATVTVLPQGPDRHRNLEEPEGTGFAVRDGRTLVTADHVIGKADNVLIRLADGTVIEAQIVLRDAGTDLAFLRITDALPALELAVDVAVSTPVCAYGNAFGLGPGLSCGVVSATGRAGVGFNPVEDFVQTDAPINPGMSGAPLVTMDGLVAGAISAIFTKGRDGDLGVNFAVSPALLEAVLEDAQDGRIDRRPAGIVLRNEPPPGSTGIRGGRIMRVDRMSPEALAGLKPGDLVLAVNGRPVAGQADYVSALALAGATGTLSFDIERAGETRRIVAGGDMQNGNDGSTK